MEEQNETKEVNKVSESTVFDYGNGGWPRDFDIRIEVAEQREILEA
ncbi:hypothetical protein RGQ13_10335 [Thalassotalea psychrophila]|uniref:Uncharacterized protein n=1 Tax=Thalassotalea psychrophila TaxID=3065647 RepID=A0ABY9TNW8_9GAMM|nr:hypothetical protein RGQ13_10335 [Colwelliaceae bacterium SQ149]